MIHKQNKVRGNIYICIVHIKKKPPTSFAGTIAKTALDNGGNGGVGVSCADVSQKIKNANICLMKHQTKVETT